MGSKKHIIDVPDVEKIGVYAIYNSKTDRYYVVSSVNIKNRCGQHRSELERRKHYNKKIMEDLKTKDDIKNFSFLVLETFDDFAITESQLREKEHYYSMKLDSYNGYNDIKHKPTTTCNFGKREKLVCSSNYFNGLDVFSLRSMSNKKLLNTYEKLLTGSNSNATLLYWCRREMIDRMNNTK